MLRLLPIFWTTVVYWTLYGFMGTFFIAQGSLMDNAVRLPWPGWLGGGGAGDSSSGGSGGGDNALARASGGGGEAGGGGGGGGGGNGSGGVVVRVPAATMALFNTGAIILLVPLYDR